MIFRFLTFFIFLSLLLPVFPWFFLFLSSFLPPFISLFYFRHPFIFLPFSVKIRRHHRRIATSCYCWHGQQNSQHARCSSFHVPVSLLCARLRMYYRHGQDTNSVRHGVQTGAAAVSLLFNGTVPFCRVQSQKCVRLVHLHFSAKNKNAWRYTSTSP
jgi:hypothetical protein